MVERLKQPIVYSCSGCSSAAQMANAIAVRMDRAGIAEMSCIAGVGGDVPSLVRVATSGRSIIAIDGCPLACSKHCLKRHGAAPDHHYVLTEFGVKKRLHVDFDSFEAASVFERIVRDAGRARGAVQDQSGGGDEHVDR